MKLKQRDSVLFALLHELNYWVPADNHADAGEGAGHRGSLAYLRLKQRRPLPACPTACPLGTGPQRRADPQAQSGSRCSALCSVVLHYEAPRVFDVAPTAQELLPVTEGHALVGTDRDAARGPCDCPPGALPACPSACWLLQVFYHTVILPARTVPVQECHITLLFGLA